MIKYFIVTKDVAKNGIFSENNGYPLILFLFFVNNCLKWHTLFEIK